LAVLECARSKTKQPHELACHMAVGVVGAPVLEQEDGIAGSVAAQTGFKRACALVDAGGAGVMLDGGVWYDRQTRCETGDEPERQGVDTGSSLPTCWQKCSF
jgi:hypothetical protein